MATTEWATKISRVLDGKVLIRGYSHERLIGDRGYAEGVFLTLRGELPTENEATDDGRPAEQPARPRVRRRERACSALLPHRAIRN